MTLTTAKVIAKTIGNAGAVITTYEIYAPRLLLAEINTHRVLAKSAASSRAIPVSKRIDMVMDNPFVPETFSKNKKGMAADEVLSPEKDSLAKEIWLTARDAMVEAASGLGKLDAHKQHANRLLEPFAYVHAVITGTEWDNFFRLRISPQAQPEFDELAGIMDMASGWYKPKASMYHLPYTDNCDPMLPLEKLFYVSAARCARVSYKTFDGTFSTVDDDIKLCNRLLAEGHMSPFDHPANADLVISDADGRRWWNAPRRHRQYWGWIPYRDHVEDNLGMVCRRDSFAEIPAENFNRG